jgi:hypothetical protein
MNEAARIAAVPKHLGASLRIITGDYSMLSISVHHKVTRPAFVGKFGLPIDRSGTPRLGDISILRLLFDFLSA